MLIATEIGDIFGPISPPPGTPEGGNPLLGLGRLFSVVIQLVILVAAITTLFQLLIAAINWVGSDGDKEKLTKAQNKILNAVVGLLLIFVAFIFFSVISNQILGGNIIRCGEEGCSFNLPHFGPTPTPTTIPPGS